MSGPFYINIQYGDTALHIAMRTEAKVYYNYLMKKGANLHVANKVSVVFHCEVKSLVRAKLLIIYLFVMLIKEWSHSSATYGTLK